MEKLKSLVPIHLKQTISGATPDDLPRTCSSLLDFFLSSPRFHQIVGEVTDREMGLCRKNAASALDWKRKGNECFSRGDFINALRFYSQKMGLLKECIRDCNRALVLSPSYAKAWYRRGEANASFGNFDDAINDLNVSLSIEGSSAGKKRIKVKIETISSHCQKVSGTSNSCNEDNENNSGSFVELYHVRLQCVSTSDKGRGMTSLDNLPPASLVLCEEPYAAIILKHSRETHCHFCFNELPADSLPCSSCTISVYCSQHCQEQAGGIRSWNSHLKHTMHENISAELESYVRRIILGNNSEHGVVDAGLDQIPEHVHECGGVHWPVILPPDIVLAGRVLAKSIEKERHSRGSLKPMEHLDLCHNYVQLPSESKLELHIYAIALAYCLQDSYGSEFPLTGTSASQLVILISQIRVNSMAVVRMKSSESYGPLEQLGKLSAKYDALTSSVEQVRVGQAIYATGSLFNHSCQPNVHAYFLSRTLFIRSTESVPKGCMLELSYGPQVGQWGLNNRQQLLEDQYSFKCQCSGCSELNLSDLVIHAFRCVKPDCLGVVFDNCIVKHEKIEADFSHDASVFRSLKHLPPVGKKDREAINEVAHLLFKRTDSMLKTGPGYCLSCGSYRDLESSHSTAKNALMNVQRLQEAVSSKQVSAKILSDALKSFNLLRSTVHAYSKDIAQAEDSLAEAFSLIGEFQPAICHCIASIEILEKLYHASHVIIGNELVKLASIQLSFNDRASAMDTIKRFDAIFSLYYGSHTPKLFPYLENLKREVLKLAP
ncbi:uncharacterized protein LOC131224678 isoform X3 [Magnolia sinica]|uniref:uncharacterized protein LOC131224678 isoform X3 n=1 Tax=Magnolia sinica TaxID=86752 RepID=UPI00265AA3F0|nr:uncharacterized protein LOC131224678 isoform X3 [Magnolia sinica]